MDLVYITLPKWFFRYYIWNHNVGYIWLCMCFVWLVASPNSPSLMASGKVVSI